VRSRGARSQRRCVPLRRQCVKRGRDQSKRASRRVKPYLNPYSAGRRHAQRLGRRRNQCEQHQLRVLRGMCLAIATASTRSSRSATADGPCIPPTSSASRSWVASIHRCKFARGFRFPLVIASCVSRGARSASEWHDRAPRLRADASLRFAARGLTGSGRHDPPGKSVHERRQSGRDIDGTEGSEAQSPTAAKLLAERMGNPTPLQLLPVMLGTLVSGRALEGGVLIGSSASRLEPAGVKPANPRLGERRWSLAAAAFGSTHVAG
jgi:hypothetical protein